ncbi:hypothetical protein [Fibrella aquatilis]|uniref:Uncharacterized protein n=1 Tax=Fibrella aquatilis TaxID=2817059 RepID=A0A939G549_9BACT|nr:hypothetical protein [Fibrella aquatilis]MBO0930201.1 hypothetical protein [Fibrella aquatilis]
MKFTLTKQDDLSGGQASIYSVRLDAQSETLLERFVVENRTDFIDEVKELLVRLRQIGHHTGARETFFKPAEGRFGAGDGIEALYDADGKHLRLYCIRNGRVAVIVGGGGPKTTRTWQEDPKLTYENKLLQLVSKTMIKALKDSDIYWSNDGLELLGNLTLDTEDYR